MCSSEDYEVARTIPGIRWNKGDRAFRLNLSEMSIHDVLRVLPDTVLSEQCADWFTKVLKRREYLRNLKQARCDFLLGEHPTLRPYQRTDIKVMTEVPRMLLANDMGTGKTVTSLMAAKVSGYKRVLIVSKLSAKWTWASEIEKWLGTHNYIVVDGQKKKRTTQFTQGKNKTFTIIHHDLVIRHSELLESEYDLIIVDEAHRYKNRKAKRTEVMFRLAKRCEGLYLVTGTPIKSRNYDVWALLHMIDPTRFSSFWTFIYRHHDVEETDFGQSIVGVKDEQYMNYELEPYMIRRVNTDPEIRDHIPRVIHKKLYVNMTPVQRKMYKSMSEDMIVEHGDTHISAGTVLALITRLRQLAISPGLILKESSFDSPKFDTVLDLLEDIDGKVVIFSMFKSVVKMLESKLCEAGYSCISITGDTPANVRPKAEEYFNNGPPKVMLTTIETSGESIQFTGADKMIFIDRHWNSTDNEQAIARCARSGQKSEFVTVFDIELRDSIESWMNRIIDSKQDLIRLVIDGRYEFVK